MDDFNLDFDNRSFTEKTNEVIDKATEKAAKVINKYGRPKYIASLIEIIISIICITGIELMTMGFDISKCATPEFWGKVGALTACIFLLYRGVVNARYDKTANRQSVLDIKEEYRLLSEDKDLDLKDYLTELNLKLKINAYVGEINKRINKLERKKIKTLKAKKKEKLLVKINTLKEEIKPERIREVIDIIHVKYYIVWYDDFQNIDRVGGNGRIITRGTQAYNRAFNIASFNKMWMYILCSVIMSISVWTFGETSKIQLIANVLSALLMIVVRIATAFIEADRLYDSTETAAFVSKIDILKQYYKWKQKKTEDEEIKELSDKPINIGTGKLEVA